MAGMGIGARFYDVVYRRYRHALKLYAVLEFGIAVTDVTNYLASVRRGFRRIVLSKLRDMTASDEEYRREANALLGVDPA